MDSNQIDKFLSGSAYKVKYLDAGSFQYYLNNDGTWKPHVIEKMPDYIYGVLNLDIIGGPGTHWVAVIQMPNGAGGSMTIFMDPLTSKGTEQLKDSPGLLNFKKKADVVLKGVLQTENLKEFDEVDEAISNYRKTDYTKKSDDMYWRSRRGIVPLKVQIEQPKKDRTKEIEALRNWKIEVPTKNNMREKDYLDLFNGMEQLSDTESSFPSSEEEGDEFFDTRSVSSKATQSTKYSQAKSVSSKASQSTLGYGNDKEIYDKVEDVYCGAYACGLIFGVLPHRIFQVSGAKRPQFVIYQKDIEDMFGIPWVRAYESRGGNTDREYKRIQEVNQQMEGVERALQPDLIIEKFYKFITMPR